MTKNNMKETELLKALKDLTAIKYLKHSKKGYIFNREYVFEKATGIKTRGKIKARIELLYRLGYFETPRTSKEVANIIQVMLL